MGWDVLARWGDDAVRIEPLAGSIEEQNRIAKQTDDVRKLLPTTTYSTLGSQQRLRMLQRLKSQLTGGAPYAPSSCVEFRVSVRG
jgi:hypothetical protein